MTRAVSGREGDDAEPVWRMGIHGAAYATFGVALIAIASVVGQPWRFLLVVVGSFIAIAGAWTLLCFVGIEALFSMGRSPAARAFVRIGFPVALAVALLWIALHA